MVYVRECFAYVFLYCTLERRNPALPTRTSTHFLNFRQLVLTVSTVVRHFPGGASAKEPACQCRRHKRCGFYPWFGKIPWRRAWQPTPVFLPREPMDRGAWWATIHGVSESDTAEWLSIHVFSHRSGDYKPKVHRSSFPSGV